MKRLFFLSSALVVLMGSLAAYAQVDYSTATLKGTVFDPNGAVISGATVTATNPSTGISKTTKAGSDGVYQIPALPPGAYQITIESPGFSKEVTKGVQLSVGQSALYDVHLKVGTVNDVVEVSGDSVALIQTEQTQQANTINQLQVDELPNINHNITQQVYTLPGVANANSPRSQNPGFTGFGTTGFSIGGSNGRNNLSTIDGGENEYGTGQYRVTTIPQDTIQEYQVNRNGFAAEFGFTNGSAINIVTKSGGNRLHGTVYGQFQNHNTSATNFFNGLEQLPRAYDQESYAGFTVGGPIKSDKLFFFVAYEYRNLNIPDFTNANILTAPTVLGPTSVQNTYVNALKNSGDPFLIGFANGITPGLTPINNPALKTILTKENGIFIDPPRLHNTLMRFDAQPNGTNSVNLRLEYSHDDGNVGNPDASGLFTRDFSILTTWNHTFTPSLINQVLVQVVPKNVANNLSTAPFQGVNFGLGNLNVGGLGGTSTFGSPSLVPYLAHQRRYQFEDNLTWSHGAHTIKVGASMRIANYNVEDDLWFNNEFDFRDGVIPLISLAPAAVQGHLAAFNLTHGFPATGPTNTNLTAPQSFAFGIPADVLAGNLPTAAGPSNPKWVGTGKYFGSYIQDSWKFNPRLTLSGGVRLDSDSEPTPLSTSFYASPRLGLAWDPFGDQKTVVRAGGGIYFAPVDVLIPSYASLLDGSGKYINELLGILSATDPRVAGLWQRGIAEGELPFGHLTPQDFAAVGFNFLTPGNLVAYTTTPNYKNPYSVEGSFSIDRQLGANYSLELGYNMYHGVHLQMPLETGFNQISPGSQFCPTAACTDATGGPLYVPNSNQIQHTTYESNASSIYHGLTSSLTKRFSHGFQFQVNYTWSKTIDNTIDFASFQNWFRPSLLNTYRAVSVFDVPHTVVANAVYNTPFKAGTGKFLDSVLADISLAPIVTVRSGLPFSIRTPGLANVVVPNPITHTLTLQTGQDQNYAMPFGATRDSNRGAMFSTTDLTFRKAFYLNRDRGIHLDLSATGTNIFNRVNFNKVSDVFDNGLPLAGTNNLFDPINGPFTGLHGVKPTSASQVTQPLSYSSADTPRQIQFGLKVAF
ncbi:MAG TPA: TonB-dependent receptor [Candidatus Angelobacter sp.]|nr:TonB-dependent receptor [Candidatus Angelobacter sp.]